MVTLLNVGFDNVVTVARIVAVVAAEPSPIRVIRLSKPGDGL